MTKQQLDAIIVETQGLRNDMNGCMQERADRIVCHVRAMAREIESAQADATSRERARCAAIARAYDVPAKHDVGYKPSAKAMEIEQHLHDGIRAGASAIAAAIESGEQPHAN